MRKTVYVGMSGGVDSSVAAALLTRQGFKVVGVYMKNWTKDVLGFSCPWRDDLNDAQSVAAKLNIPFKIFDFQKKYKQLVVDYMINEYRAGFTPNPDIMCNQEIKFKLFLQSALDDGADLIATGHYGQVKDGELFMARDQSKDQTYFLCRVTGKALRLTLMPLGDLTKTEVRLLAHKFDLPTADKPDSQGICFIGEVSIRDFLGEYIKPKTGPIKTLAGKVVGKHEGVFFYTIGQRHGLSVGGGLPYYVVGKDIKTNTLFVTNDPAADELYRSKFMLAEPHWINQKPKTSKTYQIRCRYGGRLINGSIKPQKDEYRVSLEESERAITPGQSAVVYDGDLILGGGVIALT